ncbi:hypothetical protein ABPG72_020813 [Tetrahymena utriculariae]
MDGNDYDDDQILLDQQKSPLSSDSKSINQHDLPSQFSSMNNELIYENDHLIEDISLNACNKQKETALQQEQESSNSSDSSQLSEQIKYQKEHKQQNAIKQNDSSINNNQQKDWDSKKESKIYTHNDYDDISNCSSSSISSSNSSGSNTDPQKIIELTQMSRKSKKSFKSYESKTHPISSLSQNSDQNIIQQENNLQRMSQADMNQYFFQTNTGKDVQLRKISTNQSNRLINISQKQILHHEKIHLQRDNKINSKHEESNKNMDEVSKKQNQSDDQSNPDS